MFRKTESSDAGAPCFRPVVVRMANGLPLIPSFSGHLRAPWRRFIGDPAEIIEYVRGLAAECYTGPVSVELVPDVEPQPVTRFSDSFYRYYTGGRYDWDGHEPARVQSR
jgi:hypothetical protein